MEDVNDFASGLPLVIIAVWHAYVLSVSLSLSSRSGLDLSNLQVLFEHPRKRTRTPACTPGGRVRREGPLDLGPACLHVMSHPHCQAVKMRFPSNHDRCWTLSSVKYGQRRCKYFGGGGILSAGLLQFAFESQGRTGKRAVPA